MNEPYDSAPETKKHMERVAALLWQCAMNLHDRETRHDLSKLQDPEKEAFDRMTPRLKASTYGSDEYKAMLAELGPALQHHYANNRHHPEHNTPVECIVCFTRADKFVDGKCPRCGNAQTGSPKHTLRGMTMFDLLEMLCDWRAAGERHANGSLAASLKHNRERFSISDEMAALLENTAIELGWMEVR